MVIKRVKEQEPLFRDRPHSEGNPIDVGNVVYFYVHMFYTNNNTQFNTLLKQLQKDKLHKSNTGIMLKIN